MITTVWALLHISDFSLGPSLKDIKRVSVVAPLQQHRHCSGVLHVEWIADGRSVTWPDAAPRGRGLHHRACVSPQSARSGANA